MIGIKTSLNQICLNLLKTKLMQGDFLLDFKKSSPDCNLLCFLSYMRKEYPTFLSSQTDRFSAFIQALLFWKYLEHEFFNPQKSNKSRIYFCKLIEQILTETMFFHDFILLTKFQDLEIFHRIKSDCLSIIGKLNTCLHTFKSPTLKTPYQITSQTNSVLSQTEKHIAKYIKLVNTKQPLKDLSQSNINEYQLEFFLKHNNDFCQICSITDTLSEEDFFIFCEVN